MTFHKSKWMYLLRLLVLMLCGAILGLNVYAFNAKRLIGNQMPMPFGYGAAVVLSGSMEPAISKGDLIVVKKVEEYSLREIVVYQQDSSLIVHRIVEQYGENVRTKGDANNVADDLISQSQIKGKVICCIPNAGKVVEFLKTPFGIVATIGIAILLLELPRKKEMEEYDEERRLLMEEIRSLKDEVYEDGKKEEK